MAPPTQDSPLNFAEGYRTGIIGAVTGLHAAYYAQNYGFGAVFERKVAAEMAEFMGRIDRAPNATFSAWRGDELVGSISLDGEDLGDHLHGRGSHGGIGHLRWFIVSPVAHGQGVGAALMDRAVAFIDEQGFAETRLWTFKGLDAARRLYEKAGFRLISESPGVQWGTEVTEQEFVR